jgi:hypothetical protein
MAEASEVLSVVAGRSAGTDLAKYRPDGQVINPRTTTTVKPRHAGADAALCGRPASCTLITDHPVSK